MQCTFCTTPDYLHLRLQAPSVDVSQDAVFDVCLSTRGQSALRVRAAPSSFRGQDIFLRLPRSAVDTVLGSDLGKLEVTLDQNGTRSAAKVQGHAHGALDQVRGHVASLTPDGALIGWVTNPAHPEAEVPVNLAVDGVSVDCLSEGPWFKSGFRRFEAPLPARDMTGRMAQVTAQAPGGEGPFNRSPMYVGRFDGNWVVAAPLRRDGNTLSGAFLLPAGKDIPIEVELDDMGRLSPDTVCNQHALGEYNFGNVTCGFSLNIPPRFNLSRTELVFRHPRFSADHRIPVSEILPS